MTTRLVNINYRWKKEKFQCRRKSSQNGFSFCSVVSCLCALKSSAALNFMNSINESDMSMHVKLMAEMSLQRISNYILHNNTCAFSIAFGWDTVFSS